MVREKPFPQIGLVGAALVFVALTGGKPLADRVLPTDFDGWVCTTFGGHSCTHAARLTGDDQDNLDRLKRACETGAPDQCVSAFLRMGFIHSAETLRLTILGCKLADDGLACQIASGHFSDVESPMYDPVQELFFRRLACDLEQGYSCYALAKHKFSVTGTWNDDESLQLLRKACSLEYYEACARIGEFHLSWSYGQQDLDVAVRSFEMACEGGFRLACYNLGQFYFKGAWVEKDTDKVRELLKKTCPPRSAGGGIFVDPCNTFVDMTKGIGYKTEDQNKKRRLENDCDLGDANACFHLSVFYTEYLGPEPDYEKSRALLKMACEGNHPLSCLKLSMVYSFGQDDHKKYSLVKKACNLGLVEACDMLESKISKD